jgi:hypothetical protein
MECARAAIAHVRAAFRETSPLKLIEQNHEVGAHDPEHGRDLGLLQPRIPFENSESGKLRRTNPHICKGPEEILEHGCASQRIADQERRLALIVGAGIRVALRLSRVLQPSTRRFVGYR